MTTTEQYHQALVTSIDADGEERNLVLKKGYQTTFKVTHSNFVSVNVSRLSLWEADRLIRLKVKWMNESVVDLNELYSLPAKPEENWEDLTPEPKTEIVILRNK